MGGALAKPITSFSKERPHDGLCDWTWSSLIRLTGLEIIRRMHTNTVKDDGAGDGYRCAQPILRAQFAETMVEQ